MGLAERKQKQKVGVDPRNLGWSQDHSRFSFQYLSKLGWDPSKGLGTAHEGNPTHVKVARKLDASGIGRERAIKEGREGNGPVGEGLESVLKRLKAKVGGPIVFNNDDEDENVKQESDGQEDVKVKVEADEASESGASTPVAAARVINASRAKYLKSKRLAASSPAAMAEILGFGANTPAGGSSGANTPVNGIGFPHIDTPAAMSPAPESPNIKLERSASPSTPAESEAEDPYKTFVSPLSVNEYFRQRLAQRQAQREGREVPELITDRSKLPGNAEVAKEFEGKKVTFGEDGEVQSTLEAKPKVEEAVPEPAAESSTASARKEKKRDKETEEERSARKAAEKAAKKAEKKASKRSSKTDSGSSTPVVAEVAEEERSRRKDKGKGKASETDVSTAISGDSDTAAQTAALSESTPSKKDKKDKKRKQEAEAAAVEETDSGKSSKKRRKSEGAEDGKRKKSKKDK